MRILVVEDDEAIRAVVVIALTGRDYEISILSHVSRIEECLEFDVIIADLETRDWGGLEIIGELADIGDTTPVIVMSADHHALEAVESAAAKLKKPFSSVADLRRTVAAVLAARPS